MAQQMRRQFVKFNFFKIDPAWRRLPAGEREAGKRAFQGVLERYADRMILRTYSLVGIRGDCDFMLWTISEDLDVFPPFMAELLATGLGNYASLPYSYLSQTRRSMYVDKHRHEGQEGTRLTVTPGKAKYLFVYPFVKTRAWYALPKERRQAMMDVHIKVGHEFPSVKLNTTYSYGLDDQEFVLAFESDHPSDFLDLVMVLRETEASAYTERDTPIFTCIAMPPGEMLDLVG
ncbi:MAG TPA: chlorite dismutase family protein [Chloroflexota bacterium]|nr:chlorite dismutase family protein [Chloroflexota bacterium]